MWHGSHMVFQLLLAKTREAVPIRRDFMIDAERAEIARDKREAAGDPSRIAGVRA